MRPTKLSSGRTRALLAGSVGLVSVAVLGGGVALAAMGHSPTTRSAATQGSSTGSASSAGRSATARAAATADPTASAASSDPTASASTGSGSHPVRGNGPGGKGPGGRGGPGHGDANGQGPDVLHGEFVRQTGTGTTATFVTEDVQNGTVTAVSATSLTVVSADSFSKTYVLTSSTKYGKDGTAADIAVGDTVSVRATVADSTATATDVHEHKAPTATASATPAATATS